MALPSGFTDMDTLAQTMAGRVYIAARLLPESRETYAKAREYLDIEIPEYVVTLPLHPDCYGILFEDQSLIICSNADDEVWSNESDYLDHYGLERKDHPDYGWIYELAGERKR